MKQFFFLLGLGTSAACAQNLAPAGGGGYAPPTSACLTPAQHTQIDSLVASGIRTLTRQGVLPATGSRPATVPLGWPNSPGLYLVTLPTPEGPLTRKLVVE